MTSHQRAFASKLSRIQASEVRRQVAAGSIPYKRSTPSIELAEESAKCSFTQLPVYDVAEPVDLEEILSQRRSGTAAAYDGSGSPRRLQDFPNDDVEVRVIARDSATIDSPLPPDLQLSQLDPKTADILATYSSDLCLVHRKYQQYSTGEAYNKQCFERPILADTLSTQIYEVDKWEESQRTSAEARASYASNLSSDSRSTGGESTSTQRDSSSITNLQDSEDDPIISGVTQRVSTAQMDSNNDLKRQKHRHHNVMALLPLQFDDEVIERRSAPPFPAEHSGQKLSVKIISLNMDFEFEPIFASMALYDLKEKQKLSENFYFDLNKDTLKGMLRSHIPFQDASSLSHSAIFSVTYPSSDMYLVVRLEKVLQSGDVSEALEPYVKEERNRDKLRTNALEYCERLGAYRMPVAWAMIDLSKVVMGANTLERTETMTSSTVSQTPTITSQTYNAPDTDSIVSVDRQSHMSASTTGSFRRVGSGSSFTRNSSKPPFGKTTSLDVCASNLTNFRPVALTVTNFFKQESDRLSEEDLFKFMSEAKKPQGLMKRLKFVPVTLKLEVAPYTEDVPNRLTPELLRIQPYVPAPEVDFVKELHEFPLKQVYAPNCTYRNLLYVYPKCANFSSKPGSARNISVKVELMAGQQHALPVIFGKSSCPEFSSCAYTTVSYHSKAPQFYDEVKAKLPIDLSDMHYLLFTFSHISCKAKSSDPRETQTPIGFTWLPLYKDGRLITGDFDLPISLDPLPDRCFYLSPEVNLPNIRWLDGHKPAFKVSVEAATTLHTLDDYLDSFLTLYNLVRSGQRQVADADMQSAVRNLTKAKPEPLVKFLYVVLDKLFDLMVNPVAANGQTLDVASACFEMAGQLVKILTYLLDGFCDSHSRSSLLTTYIHYHRLMHRRIMHRDPSTVSNASAVSRAKSVDEGIRSHSNPNMSPPMSPDNNKSLLEIIKGFEKASSVRTSVDFGVHGNTTGQKFLHEELALQWVVSTGSAREMACVNAWFFLELMVKVMAEYLSLSNRLYLPRKLRFTEQFIDDVSTLSCTLTAEVVGRCAKDFRQSQHMNDSLAFFVRDCFSLMDRTYVQGLVKNYCKQLTAKISNLPEQASNLMLLKLDFLRIVASHEHFLILNLPFSGALPTSNSGLQLHSPSPTPSISSRSSGASMATTTGSSQGSVGAAELTYEYRSKHFLVGLILADLAAVLESTNQTLHFRAISLVRNLLNAHDADLRITDTSMRARVAGLYLPIVGIVLDAWTQLYDPYGGKGNRHSADDDTLLFDGQQRYLGPGINPAVVQAISGGMTHSPPSSPTPLESRSALRPALTLDATRQLLASFCWVVKNLDRHAFKAWLRELSVTRMTQMLDVLQLCISCFEFKGQGLLGTDGPIGSCKRQSRLEDAMFGPKTARAEFLRNRKVTVSEAPVGVRWRKEHVHGRKPAAGVSADFDPKDFDADPITEGNLAAEISMVVLDTLELLLQVVASPGAEHLFHFVPLVTRVFLHMLACNQSVMVLENLFASQRALVTKYPELIFEQEAEQCSDLCLQLLRHCASALESVRSQAAASLYLLMRQSFESGSNLARVKMQITVSLSTLVSSARVGFNEDHLRRSLKMVLTYAEMDAGSDDDLRETSFAEQVKDLVFNLHMILSDTVKMKEFQNDFEMLMDLMYRIAKGYQNSPDLRLTWLQSMASKHVEKHNFAEAAQCLLHASALSAEYLHMMEDLEYLPGGAADFLKLSENILEESAVSDDVVSPEEEGICESRYFTENGLLSLLEQAAHNFSQAQMYETMEWTYKLMLPILEEARDYKRISQIHLRISEALGKIDCQTFVTDVSPALDLLRPICNADKRVFGTYFRVGFYGNRFGDLDGAEYVYKEPAITKLAEISHRLESFYSDRFGHGVVKVVKDSNVVVRHKLEPDKAYLQITYVEPYFDRWELRRRPTHFERNYNCRRFVFATPFTLDGRAHGDLRDQYKRRTILTTAYSFPYLKTRVQVIDREQTVLSPVEVAIEDVQKKTRELAAATTQEPADAKMLQMVLQGCIGTTVNQGPIEVANIFLGQLSMDADGHPVMDKHQNKLRLCFKDFSKKCSDALRKNKRLIASDQEAYQKELERNYVEFTKKLSPLVSTAAVQTLKRQSRHITIDELDDQPATAV